MCYPPTGDIMFSLKRLKFYGNRGLGPDNPNTHLNLFIGFILIYEIERTQNLGIINKFLPLSYCYYLQN